MRCRSRGEIGYKAGEIVIDFMHSSQLYFVVPVKYNCFAAAAYQRHFRSGMGSTVSIMRDIMVRIVSSRAARALVESHKL